MSKATRIEHRWCDDDGDGSFIVATYRVEGHEERLFSKAFWAVPITTEEQRREAEPYLLGVADADAEWCAENAEDLPTAQWAFT